MSSASIFAPRVICYKKKIGFTIPRYGISYPLFDRAERFDSTFLIQDAVASRTFGREIGWLFLAIVLDLFSRMVVGWSMAAIQDATLVVKALHMAIVRRRPQAGLLHHTDRGSTYTSEDYQSLVRAARAWWRA